MAAPTREHLATREAEIQALVKEEKRDEAGKILFDLIVSCAQGGDIRNASRLRDMFYDVNSMALTEIIKANEIIEDAMSGSISDHFALTWAGLRKALNEEEFTAIYHALEEHEIEQNKLIVKAGSRMDAIFLVNTGNINVICHCLGKNNAIKVLEPGSMSAGNFFYPSLWTVSLVSLTPVKLSVLRFAQLVELEERFPGFENNLAGFYKQFDDIPRLLKEQELHRRRFKRFKVNHKITFQAVKSDGAVDDRIFRGELNTLSRGGLSFLIRIVKRTNRRQLFGRRLSVAVQADNNPLLFTGMVAAVTIQDFQTHDYAIHVAFDQPVSEESILPLIPPEPDDEEALKLEPEQQFREDETSLPETHDDSEE